MEFNNEFIKHVERIAKASKEFDDLYKGFIGKINSDTNDKHNVRMIYLLTQKYVMIRATHGKILLMLDQYMNTCIEHIDLTKDLVMDVSTDTDIDSDYVGKLYDISTFKSIVSDVNLLMANVDAQYKRVSAHFPKHIGKKQFCVVLFVDSKNTNVLGKNERLLKIKDVMEKAQREKPDHVYKIIPTQLSDDGNPSFPSGTQGLGLNTVTLQKLNIKKLPALYILDSSTITEIPIKSSGSNEIFASIINIIETL